ncbi:MAG: DNA adenine methylase [Leptospiraceae bacterium]|nr:DNA adenine methylase [Leptospiraceae bacterium]MCP5495952.1 DNA adenine methylase [Leptospiraceae bacterium]
MRKSKLVAPVVKWVGGKRQVLTEIQKYIPKYTNYYEPFVGGGAVLFELQPNNAIVNDKNNELISMYQVIKSNVEELINDLKQHKNDESYFYETRELDRNKDKYNKLDPIQKASRIIFLNKTCYNGLFRVNRAGEFNAPFGSYKNPNIVNEVTLRAVNKYFNKNNITILCCDFEAALNGVKKGAFVYLDPPYDPVSDTASFTGYEKGGFGKKEQIRLKEVCDVLDKQGVKFLLSNSSTDFIKELYKEYRIEVIQAKRAINSNPNKRGEIDEVLVRNYE